MSKNRQAVQVRTESTADGRVSVRQLYFDGRWMAVEQGRQWLDDEGRHILIRLNGRVQCLTQMRSDLTWYLHPLPSDKSGTIV